MDFTADTYILLLKYGIVLHGGIATVTEIKTHFTFSTTWADDIAINLQQYNNVIGYQFVTFFCYNLIYWLIPLHVSAYLLHYIWSVPFN